jgi:beta propeller repeat protein
MSGLLFPLKKNVSGNNVVFVDELYGYEDIVLINLSSGEEEIISHVPDIQWQPDIDKDWIVWEDWRDGAHSRGDIYAFHLPTRTEVQVTDTSWGDWFPAVSSEWVVWQSQKYGNFDIFAMNLTTRQEVQITTDPSRQWLPRILGDQVV